MKNTKADRLALRLRYALFCLSKTFRLCLTDGLSRNGSGQDENLEPLPGFIWNKLKDWVEGLHMSVYEMVLYFLGPIIVRFSCPTEYPILVDVAFVIIELSLIRVCYDVSSDLHIYSTSVFIFAWYIGTITRIMDFFTGMSPLRTMSFINKPWECHVIYIAIICAVLLIKLRKKRKMDKEFTR